MTSGPSSIVRDKYGKFQALSGMGRVVLELGCGRARRVPGAITVDALDYESVDVVGDVYDVLAMLADGSVDEVVSSHFVEHLPDLAQFVRESRRVLKVGGLLRTVAPHFSNPYFYSDYTHRSHFGLYTFSYLSEDRLLRRQVPHYVEGTGLELTNVRLVFKASPPFYMRHALGKVVETLVNLSTWSKEAYERGWCYAFPCYEVEYLMQRRR